MNSSDREKQLEFMELFGSAQNKLEKYCLSISANRDDAKDLINETILQTYIRFYKIKDKTKFTHYLFRVAKRLHLKKARTLYRFLRIEKEVFIKEDGNPDASHQLDVRIVYEALSKLPLKLKQAVILHQVTGFSLKEVAEIEGCSLSAVKARVMRGRNKLSELLLDKESNVKYNSKVIYSSTKSN